MCYFSLQLNEIECMHSTCMYPPKIESHLYFVLLLMVTGRTRGYIEGGVRARLTELHRHVFVQSRSLVVQRSRSRGADCCRCRAMSALKKGLEHLQGRSNKKLWLYRILSLLYYCTKKTVVDGKYALSAHRGPPPILMRRRRWLMSTWPSITVQLMSTCATTLALLVLTTSPSAVQISVSNTNQ